MARPGGSGRAGTGPDRSAGAGGGDGRRAGRGSALGARLRRSAWLHGALAALGAGYIGLVRATVRWRVEGREHFDAVLAEGGGVIATLWHGRLFLSPCLAPPGRRTIAMISQSRDGDVIARIVGWWGVGTVRGSSYDRAKGRDKGGGQALAGGAAALEAGSVLAITPDGPRGPRRCAQAGAAQLALDTGAPVLPIAFSSSPARALGSWDRFLLPLPFGRGAIVYGAPVPLPAEGRHEERVAAMTATLERMLSETTDRADDLVGRPRETPPPEAPAPAPAADAARPQTGA